MLIAGGRFLRRRERMRPLAGVGKLKHAPPMQADDWLVVAPAIPQHLAGGGRQSELRSDAQGGALCH